MEALRIVLLGASGFVGRAIVRRAATMSNERVQIRALVRTPEKKVDTPFAASVVGALPQVAPELFPAQPYVVVHFGVKQIDTDGSGFEQTNVIGTRALLSALTPTCAGIIYSSSAAVYGRGAQTGNDEDAPVRPETPLARSLAKAEMAVFEAGAKRNIDAYALRPRFVLGNGDHFILPGFVKLFRRGWVLGDGNQAYTIIDVDDYADIVLRLVRDILGQRGCPTESIQTPLNIGYTRPVTQSEIRAVAAECMNLPAVIRSVPISPAALKCFGRLPFRKAHSLVSKLLLVGVDHRVLVHRLGAMIGTDIVEKDPLAVVERAMTYVRVYGEEHES